MTTFTQNFLRYGFFFLFLLFSISGQAKTQNLNGPDLELTSSASIINPPLYSNTTISLSLSNTGNAPMTGIVVDFPVPATMAFVGQNIGTGIYFNWTGEWKVGDLAAGQTASMDLTLFTLSSGAVEIYAQVASHLESDVDSSPGNGQAPTPLEDDETLVIINGGMTPCSFTDLGYVINCSSNSTPNIDDDTYSISLQPSGINLGQTYTLTATSFQWNGPNFGVNSFPYGSVYTSPDFLISNGGFELKIEDDQGECIEIIQVIPPLPCSSSGLPDFTVELDNYDPVQVEVNSALDFNYFFQNTGDIGTFTITNELLLSTDQVISNDDLDVNPNPSTVTVNGQFIYTTAPTLFIPPGTAPGTYWMIVKVDFLDEITESNESNNIAIRRIDVVDPNPCELEILTSPSVCFNQGTSDPTDDNFGFFIRTNKENFNGVQYTLEINNNSTNSTVPFPIDYGAPFHISRFISGGPVEVVATDINFPGCTTTKVINPVVTCSGNSCPLSVNYIPPLCGDNGTPTNSSDDIFTFSLFVQTLLTGNNDNYKITLSNLVNTATFIRPYTLDYTYSYRIADGPVIVTIVDERDPNCTTNITIPVPAYCQPPAPVTCADNLLVNPGYEANSTYYYRWYSLGGASLSTDANSGNLAVRISGTAPGGILQTLPAQPGKTYALSAYAKRTTAPAQSTGNYISLKFLSSTYQPLETLVDIIPEQANYSLFERSYTAPPGTAYVEAKAFKDNGDFELFLDDWCLTDGPSNPCSPDQIAPQISNCPADLTVSTLGNSSTASWTIPTATDNCALSNFYPSFVPNLYEFPLGKTTVTYTAIDAAGNEATCSFDVTVIQQNNSGKPDLELAISSSQNDFDLWQYLSVTLTVNNTGDAAATDVFIDFQLPDGTVFQGGNEYSASQGIYRPNSTRQWSLGSLPIGGTASITVNLFTIQAVPSLISYAQVWDMAEEDFDSTPGNGLCCQLVEDDEAVVTLFPSPNAPLAKEQVLSKVALRKLYPNPAMRTIQVVVESPEAIRTPVVIYNSWGQLMLRQNIDLEVGTSRIELAIEALPAGLYYVHLPEAHQKFYQLKFVKIED